MNNTTINKNQQLANVENLNSHNHNNRGVKAFSKIVKICLVYTSFVFIASKICLNLNVATKKLCQDFSLPKWVDILLCFIVVIFSALTPIGLTYFIFDLCGIENTSIKRNEDTSNKLPVKETKVLIN